MPVLHLFCISLGFTIYECINDCTRDVVKYKVWFGDFGKVPLVQNCE